MFNNTNFPYMNTQQLNLDWLLKKIKEILKFMPLNGNVGDVLQRKAEGAAWEPIAAVSMDINGLQTAEAVADDDEIPIYDKSATGNRKATVAAIRAGVSYPVTSVNGKAGAVVLDAADVGALPDTYTAPVTSVNGQTGAVTAPKKVTLSGTTGGAGQRYINASDYPNVINVVCKTNGYAALLYAPVPGDPLWFVLFLNQSLSPAANTDVTYDVYYI